MVEKPLFLHDPLRYRVLECLLMPRMIDLVRASALPSTLVQSMAKGAIALPPREVIEILVYLATHNPEVKETAAKTLAGWNETQLRTIIADPKVPREVAKYFDKPMASAPAPSMIGVVDKTPSAGPELEITEEDLSVDTPIAERLEKILGEEVQASPKEHAPAVATAMTEAEVVVDNHFSFGHCRRNSRRMLFWTRLDFFTQNLFKSLRNRRIHRQILFGNFQLGPRAWSLVHYANHARRGSRRHRLVKIFRYFPGNFGVGDNCPKLCFIPAGHSLRRRLLDLRIMRRQVHKNFYDLPWRKCDRPLGHGLHQSVGQSRGTH